VECLWIWEVGGVEVEKVLVGGGGVGGFGFSRTDPVAS